MHEFYIDRSGNYTYYCINYLGDDISYREHSKWNAKNFHITIPEELEGGDVNLVLEQWIEEKAYKNDQTFCSTLNKRFVEKYYDTISGAKESINLIALDGESLIKDYYNKMVFELVDFGKVDFNGFSIDLDQKFNAASVAINRIETNYNYALDESYSNLCLKKIDDKIIITIPNKLYHTPIDEEILYALNNIISAYAAILSHYYKKQVYMCPKCYSTINTSDKFEINASMHVSIKNTNMGDQLFKCPTCEKMITPKETILMDEPIVRVCKYINDTFYDLKTIYSCCGHNVLDFNAYINLQKNTKIKDYLGMLKKIISEDTIFENMFYAEEPLNSIVNGRIAVYFIHDYIYELLREKHSFTNAIDYIMDQYIRLFEKLYSSTKLQVQPIKTFRDPNR